jgi:50S ribosomal protein L16 3-hydroxylase
MHFKNFDIDAFLRDHWQKTPLLIRNPWAAWQNPLEPDEFAGLACEEDVESRLITHKGGGWELEHGPFDESRFATLGSSNWTQLVQAVDHFVPDVAALIDAFRFVPNWRIDDVMVSYASDGGGVGPHFDQYDVFLIQGLGRRRWQIGGTCDENTPLLPHDDLRLLAEFQVAEEWILEPGDILYVPPGIAHNGVAVGDDCMTYSIGFRAPSRSELISNWTDELIETLVDDDRYTDPGLAAQANPGEISPAAIAKLHAMVTEAMQDRDAFVRWFGQYNSLRKYPDIDWQPEEPIEIAELRDCLADGQPLCRNPASRFSFVRQAKGCVLLFVDGDCFDCVEDTAALAEMLCAQDRIALDPALIASDAVMTLVATLYNQGSVAFDEEN